MISQHIERNVRVAPGHFRWHMVPKVASTTVGKAFKYYNTFMADPTEYGTEPRFMFVRSPLSRLESWYKFTVLGGRVRDNNYTGIYGYKHNMSWEEFLVVVENAWHKNRHTVPMVNYKGPFDVNLIPLHRATDLGFTSRDKDTSNTEFRSDGVLPDSLIEVYAEDQKLWEQALETQETSIEKYRESKISPRAIRGS